MKSQTSQPLTGKAPWPFTRPLPCASFVTAAPSSERAGWLPCCSQPPMPEAPASTVQCGPAELRHFAPIHSGGIDFRSVAQARCHHAPPTLAIASPQVQNARSAVRCGWSRSSARNAGRARACLPFGFGACIRLNPRIADSTCDLAATLGVLRACDAHGGRGGSLQASVSPRSVRLLRLRLRSRRGRGARCGNVRRPVSPNRVLSGHAHSTMSPQRTRSHARSCA